MRDYMKRQVLEYIVFFLLVIAIIAAVFLTAGCAGLDQAQKDAMVEQTGKVVSGILDIIPGGGLIGDASTLVLMIWGLFKTKKYAGKKMKQLKDSMPNEYFSKNTEA